MMLLRVFAALCLCIAAIAQTNQVTISVRDPAGVPVPGALVSLSPLPQYVNQRLTMSATFLSKTTAVDGTAQFTGLPQGSFGICSQPPKAAASLMVDSCSWAVHPQILSVNSTQTQNIVVQLQRAAPVLRLS